MLLKMTLGFPKVKWLHLTGEADKSVRFSWQIFSGFNTPKNHKSVFYRNGWTDRAGLAQVFGTEACFDLSYKEI